MSDAPVATVLGRLRGNVITLDAPVPPLDGKRVAVVVRPVEEDDARVDAEPQAEWWRSWVERGPQGPIEDEGEPEFP